MRARSLLLFTLFSLAFCTAGKEDGIRIEGNVSGIPDGKLYLTTDRDWRTVLDSTTCTDGRFVFHIQPDSSFVPYMASIHFPDSSRQTGVQSLAFRVHTLGTDSSKNAITSFYVEKGVTRLEGTQKAPFIRVFAPGPETDLMYSHMRSGFGGMDNRPADQRQQLITAYGNKIKTHPFSYFLLLSLYDYKAHYSEEELNGLLSLFNPDVQASSLGHKFKTYFANRVDAGQAFPDLHFLNADNQPQRIVNADARLNMVVFWASWCKPCRMEIPVLKEIHKEYGGKGLNIVSVSIDEYKEAWLQAVSQEEMAWPQAVVEKSDHEKVMDQFNLSGVPLVVFLGKDAKEVARFIGYEEDGKAMYGNVIRRFIQ